MADSSGKDELELTRALDTIQAFIWARIKDEADARNIKLSTGDCYALCSVIKEQLHPRVRQLIAQQTQQAVQKLIFKLMSVKTEGLFDNGDLFIKRRPLEDAYINILGYEKFKAIQEAVDKQFALAAAQARKDEREL